MLELFTVKGIEDFDTYVFIKAFFMSQDNIIRRDITCGTDFVDRFGGRAFLASFHIGEEAAGYVAFFTEFFAGEVHGLTDFADSESNHQIIILFYIHSVYLKKEKNN